MSIREKSGWITLATTVIIWGFYFLTVWQRYAEGVEVWSLTLLVKCIAVSLVAQWVLMGVAAARTPKDQRALSDEREILIDGRATTVSYTVLTLMVLGAAVVGSSMSTAETGALVSQGLVLALVLAEVVKSAVAVGLHRTGGV